MNQPLPELPLAKSITDDDDSHDEPVARYSVPNENQDVDPRALAYLLRYETMIRQQETEEMATLDHIRPLMDRIQSLGGDSSDSSTYSRDDSRIMDGEVSYSVLTRALSKLEGSSEVMTTDKQLMMVLRTLSGNAHTGDETITLAEFVQCYKTVVTGMQTLQHLPGESVVRSRARDRTLSIVSLFEPASTKLLNENRIFGVKEEEHTMSKSVRRRGTTGRIARAGGCSRVVLVIMILLLAFLGLSLGPSSFLGSLQKYMRSLDGVLLSDRRSAMIGGAKSNAASHFSVTSQNILPMESLKLTRSFKGAKDEQKALSTFLRDNPTLRKSLKTRMVGSAVAGGAAGALLAPTIWSTLRILVPKAISGIATAAPGLNPAVAISALIASSLAVFHGGFHNRRSRQPLSLHEISEEMPEWRED